MWQRDIQANLGKTRYLRKQKATGGASGAGQPGISPQRLLDQRGSRVIPALKSLGVIPVALRNAVEKLEGEVNPTL